MPHTPAHRPGQRANRCTAALTVAAAITASACASSPGADSAPAGLTARAAQLGDTNRAVVEEAVVRFFHVSQQIAALVKLDQFPTAPNASQLQRMADHMQASGLLAQPLNVAPLIFR